MAALRPSSVQSSTAAPRRSSKSKVTTTSPRSVIRERVNERRVSSFSTSPSSESSASSFYSSASSPRPRFAPQGMSLDRGSKTNATLRPRQRRASASTSLDGDDDLAAAASGRVRPPPPPALSPDNFLPLPPRSEWPHYPVLVRCSPDVRVKVHSGTAGLASAKAEEAMREEVRAVRRVALEDMREHLDRYLERGAPQSLSFAAWIAELHPENVIHSASPFSVADELLPAVPAEDNGDGPKIDSRLYLPASEYLQMWNAHPSVTTALSVEPRGTTTKAEEEKKRRKKEEDNGGHYTSLCINDSSRPVYFETALFVGRAIIRIADLPAAPDDDPNGDAGGDDGASAYFCKGRKRKMQVCVQGRFKQPLRFDQVYGGQEFSRPLKNIPAKRVVRWAFGILRPRLPESFAADLFCAQPFFLSPLVLTSTRARCDRPEEAPGVASFEFSEDMSLHVQRTAEKRRSARQSGCDDEGSDEVESAELLTDLSLLSPPSSSSATTKSQDRGSRSRKRSQQQKGPNRADRKNAKATARAAKAAQAAKDASSIGDTSASGLKRAKRAEKKAQKAAVAERKQRFGSSEALRENCFDTDLVYTFDYYQQFYRAASNQLDLGVKLMDLTHFLGPQPLLLTMAKTIDTNEYLWKFEIWHEKGLQSD